MTYENYRNHVDNLEAEFEKINGYAKNSNFEIDPSKFLGLPRTNTSTFLETTILLSSSNNSS